MNRRVIFALFVFVAWALLPAESRADKPPGSRSIEPAPRTPTPTPTPAEIIASFDIGGSSALEADPVRNRVYFIDRTGIRVLALDTGTGQIAAAAPIEGIVPPDDPQFDFRFGQMAVSRDAGKLYLALPEAQQIRVFSLPDLAPLTNLPVNFHSWGLCETANNRLFSSFGADFVNQFGSIREVNPATGRVLQSFEKEGCVQCGCPNCYYFEYTLLHTNAAGSRLFAAEPNVSVSGGPGYIFEYDITGATAALVRTHPFNDDYMNDFAVDEQQQRFYTMNGGIYGVELTDMSPTGTYGTVWPIGGYACAVKLLPGDTVVYGASADSLDGRIRKYRRTDGAPLTDWIVGTNGKGIMERALAITPNGRLVYFSNRWLGCVCGFGGWEYHAGIIGRNSITLDNLPSDGGPAHPTLTAVNFADPEGNNNGAPNGGEIVRFSPALTNIGTQNAPDISVDLTAGAGATLLSPPTQSIGSLPAGWTVTAAPFRLQLAQTFGNATNITVTFTVHWGSGQSATFPYTLVLPGALPTRITSIVRSGSSIVVTCYAYAGLHYHLESSPSLINPSWGWVTTDIVATTDGPLEMTHGAATFQGHGFYRVSSSQ